MLYLHHQHLWSEWVSRKHWQINRQNKAPRPTRVGVRVGVRVGAGVGVGELTRPSWLSFDGLKAIVSKSSWIDIGDLNIYQRCLSLCMELRNFSLILRDHRDCPSYLKSRDP